VNEYERTVNRLAKWRTVFAGRWLGTRAKDDPECQAVRDITEKYLMLRVEMNAMTALLLRTPGEKTGLFTIEEFERQVIKECDYMQAMLEESFPGFKATDDGMHIDTARAAETMKGWKP
jgi:hypothetical protein